MRGALAFIFGAVTGATVSYFVTAKIERDKATDQIEAVKAKMAELKEDNDILRDVRQKAEANYEKPIEMIVPEESAGETDYNAISVKKKKSKPKVVKEEEIKQVDEHAYFTYINSKDFEEKVFTFYQGDNSLVDEETGMLVPDPERFVGADGVDAMSKLTVEETYYADEANKSISCITISEDSYYGSEEETE